jgi:tetratricopeptide (TPR) repeat protein
MAALNKRSAGIALAVATWLGLACALPGAAPPPSASFHLSSVADQGDPARRASTRLALRGLDADAESLPDEAAAFYDRALQVDPTNPYVYLCLARHDVEDGAPEQAEADLDKADALVGSLDARQEGIVRVYLMGLRGAALEQQGNTQQGLSLLDAARKAAPEAWADGRLDAAELR